MVLLPAEAAPVQKSYHVVPEGRYTDREVALYDVIGLTMMADPNMYCEATLKQPGSGF